MTNELLLLDELLEQVEPDSELDDPLVQPCDVCGAPAGVPCHPGCPGLDE